jgi:hypothetical protein
MVGKVTRVTAVGLVLFSMTLMSCAPGQKIVITQNNLTALKGTWSGWTTLSSAQANPVLTTLVISNDTIPLQGKITLSNLPSGVVSYIPAESLSAGNQVVIDFRNGKISDQGTIISQSGQNFLELSYNVGENPTLDGWFYYYGANGALRVSKK